MKWGRRCERGIEPQDATPTPICASLYLEFQREIEQSWRWAVDITFVERSQMTDKLWPSVTQISCTCGALQKFCASIEFSVEFDGPTKEYRFYCQPPGEVEKNYIVLRHCPMCGGKAPKVAPG